MSSLIEGYNYDIFISYRQKDNKHDGWVTEFVNHLKGELESTFKEEISVYFDINPHDGLLETHDVNASLKEKLKCLIFIPIISRTYCDPKSFAWEHEFKAFVEMASKDQFGLKIKLTGSNVASRVLPVQIHVLEQEDKKTFENELGGHIRGIEFIYRQPGVNKPLKPDDDEKINLNKTKYSYQINKVANAVKEMINGIRISEPTSSLKTGNEEEKGEIPVRRTIWKALAILAFILLILVSGYFLISGSIKKAPETETSIAVIPFINDSPDKESSDYIVNGLLVEIINNLQQIKSFSRVLPRTSVEKYRSTIKSAPEIAKELNVNYILNGSAQKIGDNLVVKIDLTDAKRNNVLKTYSFNERIATPEQIFNIYSKVAQSVADELKARITPEEREQIEKAPTKNLTALDFYMRGKAEEINFTTDLGNPSLKRAELMYRKALSNDNSFAAAYAGLAYVNFYKRYNSEYYNTQNFLDSFLILINKSLFLDDKLADAYYLKGLYYLVVGEPESALKEYDYCLEYNPNYWQAYRDKATWIYGINSKDGDYIQAIVNMEKAISLNHGKEHPGLIRSLGDILGPGAGFSDLAINHYKNAVSIDNDSVKYFSLLAGVVDNDKAERYRRKSLSLNPGNMDEIQSLGYLLDLKGDFASALTYHSMYANWIKNSNQLGMGALHRIGYTYWMNGNKKEADFWFSKQKYFDLTSIKNNRYGGSIAPTSYYDLACVYAFEGEKDSAYLNLRKLDEMKVFPSWWIGFIKTDPLLKNLRKDTEFQYLVNRLESKYKAEHERVRKWLEENNIL